MVEIAPFRGARPWVALSGERPDERVLAQARGIGLIRSEYVVRGSGQYFGGALCGPAVNSYLRAVLAVARNAPVWYRFADLEARDINALTGGRNVVHDDNPLLGARGARRLHRFPEEFRAELAAVADVAREAPGLGFVVPFCRDAGDFERALAAVRAAGLENPVGAMVEVPSAALGARDLVAAGAACLLVGLNDLTGLTLGSGRGAPDFEYGHPATLELVERVWQAAESGGVEFRIAGNYPAHVPDLLPFVPAAAWTVHYADWSRLVDPGLGPYQDQDVVLRLREDSDARLISAGVMHPANAVATAGLGDTAASVPVLSESVR